MSGDRGPLANDYVHNQLAQQRITFTPATALTARGSGPGLAERPGVGGTFGPADALGGE